MKISELKLDIDRKCDSISQMEPKDESLQKTLDELVQDTRRVEGQIIGEARNCAEREKGLKQLSETAYGLHDQMFSEKLGGIKAKNRGLFDRAKDSLLNLRNMVTNTLEDMRENGPDVLLEKLEGVGDKVYAVAYLELERSDASREMFNDLSSMGSSLTWAEGEDKISLLLHGISEYINDKYEGKDMPGALLKITDAVENISYRLAEKAAQNAEMYRHYSEQFRDRMDAMAFETEELTGGNKIMEAVVKNDTYDLAVKAYKRMNEEHAGKMNPIVQRAAEFKKERMEKAHTDPTRARRMDEGRVHPMPAKTVPIQGDELSL